MIVVSHESHDMYNPIFVLINLLNLKKKNSPSAATTESQSYAIAAITTDGPSEVCLPSATLPS